MTTGDVPPIQARRALTVVAWLAIVALAVGFVGKYVFHYYLNFNKVGFDYFWPTRGTLLLHITAGMVALLVGPWQFWTGLRTTVPAIHRWTGRLYLIAVAFGAAAATRLAITTPGGWAYGLGLGSLALAWVVTTGTAWFAIRNRVIEQHRRWMIRSYVVTFGFVTFRLYDEWLPTAHWKPDHDRVISEGWACWALPLLAVIVIQGVQDIRRSRSPQLSSRP